MSPEEMTSVLRNVRLVHLLLLPLALLHHILRRWSRAAVEGFSEGRGDRLTIMPQWSAVVAPADMQQSQFSHGLPADVALQSNTKDQPV